MNSVQDSKALSHKHLLALLLWTILWALFFFTILVGSQRFPTSDFTEQFHAFTSFQAREMAQGRLPIWSPHSFGGVPFAADPQAAVFYLPRWLTIIASLPWGFTLQALQLEAIAHIWLAGVFTYALAYSITRSSLASLLAGVAFGLGGYLTSYPVLQLAILETITWLPLVLLLIREGVRRAQKGERPAPVAWFAGAGLALALSITAGHPQTFLYVAYLAAGYYLFLTVRARWRWTSIVLFGLLIAAVGVLVSSPLWLPAGRFYALSTRAGVDYDFISPGQPMLHYVQILAPAVMTVWSPEYLGLAGVILALLAWLGRRVDADQKAEIIFWGAVLLLSILIALGDSGVIFQLLYYIAPGFSLFRQQERLLAIASLSGALLAAQGVSLWLRMEDEQRRKYVRRTALVFIVLFSLVAIILIAARPKTVAGWQSIVVRQAIVAILVFALLSFDRRPRLQALLLTLLLAGDLYASTFSGIARQDDSAITYWLKPDWLAGFMEEYQQTAPSRLDSGNIFWANAGEVYGWEDLSGISPVKPKVLEEMQQLPNERFWQLLNVSHVIRGSPVDNGSFTLLSIFNEGLKPDRKVGGHLYRFDAALPRAWMVYRWDVVPDAESSLTLLADPEFDPATQVVLQTTMSAVPKVDPPAADSPPPHVDASAPAPGQLEIEVANEYPGFLVISEWANPGWVAYLDGNRAPLYAADYGLQAIWVPAGVHHITLVFQPLEVTIGVIASLLAIVGAVLLAWRWRPAVARAHAARERLWPWQRLPEASIPRERKLNKSWRFWLVVAVIFLGFSLRIYRLGEQELRGDEGISYGYTLRSATDIIFSVRGSGNPHSPFHYLMLNGWMNLAGDSELAMRFISLIPGLLAIPLAFLLGRRLAGWRFGILFASLMAIAQSLVWVSQDTRNQYTLTVFFALLATWLLLEALRRHRWQWWALYAVAAALTVYSHYYGVFALLAQGGYLLLRSTSRREWLAWLASSLGAFLLFLPWIASSLPYIISRGRHFSRPSTPNLANHLIEVGTELSAGTAVAPRVGRWLFFGMLLLCFLGMAYLWQRKRPLAGLLIFWLVGTAIGIYLVRFSRDTFNTYYVSVAAPAWWALVGAGLLALWRKADNSMRLLAAVSLLAIVLVQLVALANYYFDPNYSRTLGYQDMLATLSAEVEPGDVIVAHYPDASLTYYIRDLSIPHIMQPAKIRDSDEQTNQNLADLADQYDRLWFLPAHRSIWDPEDVAFRWFDYHTLLEQESKHDRVTLTAYRPLSATSQILAPVGDSLNQLLELEGAYLTVDGEPLTLLQGSVLRLPVDTDIEVTLVWQALAEIPESYTAFVHILSEDGRLLTQHDGVPSFGTRPTQSWVLNERILDKHRLVIPAEAAVARGTLVVGMYQSDTLERQAFASGAEQLWLADVEITAAGFQGR